MKIFERRMQLSWPNLIFGSVFAVFAGLSLASGDAFVPRGRIGTARHILKGEDPSMFFWLVAFYAALALSGYFFARFSFRRGSWMNPR